MTEISGITNKTTSFQAMIFAAGLGTRLKPLTDSMPKALVKIGGIPMLERTILNLKAAGCKRIVVNVHHFASLITDFLSDNGNFGMDILVSNESDCLLDTGGGLKKAAPLFLPFSPILIHNVDILSNINLKSFYINNVDSNATLLVSNRKTKRYLLFSDDMQLVGWTNIETGEVKSPYDNIRVSDCRCLAFSGIHTFSPRLFPLMNDFPNKFGIIDFYLKVCDKVVIRGVEKNNLKILDIGKLDSLSKAEIFINQIQ
ncbi:MAG: NTP transferase domain-containing protein [Prevotella sp.]|nr:NTP transferase domain-containing protein [Prevotella sp.]